MEAIYMDNAATSWPKPGCVYEAIDCFNRQMGASPGRGLHQKTLVAGRVLLEAREALARLFNVSDISRLAFTANATESLNIGLKGLLNPGDHVVISGMEHNAVARPLHTLEKTGVTISVAQCAPDGSLELDAVVNALRDKTRVVCLLHASNVTGTLMPISEVSSVVHRHGAVFMVDAAQTAGIIPIDVEADHIDVLCFSGHKGLFGPQGTGGIYIRPGLEVRSLKEGGTGSYSEHVYQPEFMPDKFESGTPNTPGIAGLGAGARFVMEIGVERIRWHEQDLTTMLVTGLREIKKVTLYGPADSSRQVAVVSLNVDGLDCGELSLILDRKYGISSRSGLHCAPMAHRTIGTLSRGVCRLSPGFFNTREDVATTIRAVYEIARSVK